MLPASNSGLRKGMFVTVTGGPGTSGIAAADPYTAMFDTSITDSFDLVFFDQRGVALSGGLTSPVAAATFYQADMRTDTPAREAALKQAARTFSQNCVNEMSNPVSLPYLGTVQAVEDLESFRQVMHESKFWLYGESYGPRETRRRELIDTVGKTVQTIVESYDRNKEASELAASIEAAVAQTALLEVGAVGLGALVAIAVLSSTLDITGILTASTLAVLGFFVIPFKRKQAKDRFKEKMLSLRSKLLGVLTAQFRDESENVIARLKDGVSPYTRYVRSERERIDKAENTLARMRLNISELRARSQAVVAK